MRWSLSPQLLLLPVRVRKRDVNYVVITSLIMLFVLILYTVPDQRPASLRAQLEKGEEAVRVVDGRVCSLTSLNSDSQFLDYFNITQKDPACKNWRKFGQKDGRDKAKYVCLDDAYDIKANRCLVLSIGVSKWAFEEDFDHFGCQVYALEPLQEPRDLSKLPNTRVLPLGLASFVGQQMAEIDGRAVFYKVTRYKTLLQHLGLTRSLVDYLSVDARGSELDLLEDVFATCPDLVHNVKQFSMRLYHGPSENENLPPGVPPRITSTFSFLWTHFQLLHCHGFQLLHTRQLEPYVHEAVWGRVVNRSER
ncbi:uncharacterized protein [Panulirus ornatus]|uniref:uncharacterized protein n=1 Tax=Panulirus ornatus TaxID=150431 RepID=UPI003A85DDA9